MSVELQDWKAAIRDSVADYLLNPCLKTAKSNAPNGTPLARARRRNLRPG